MPQLTHFIKFTTPFDPLTNDLTPGYELTCLLQPQPPSDQQKSALGTHLSISPTPVQLLTDSRGILLLDLPEKHPLWHFTSPAKAT